MLRFSRLSPTPPSVTASASPSFTPPDATARLTALLRWSCALLFFARAWQHLRWDAPFRALLWSEETMSGAVAFFLGLDWQTYATSPVVAQAIDGLTRGFGGFYLLCGVAALACAPGRRWTRVVLGLGALALVFLAHLYQRDRLLRLGEFGEYALQFTLPAVLVFWIQRAPAALAVVSRPVLLRVLAVATALSFACHGLYAAGAYPTPGEWVTMTCLLTGLDDLWALRLLRVAGVLDFVVALAVLLPFRRVALPALAYAAAWGLATALARSAAFVRWENLSESSAQWLHETVLRLPHAAVPLVLFLALRRAAAAPAPRDEPTPFPVRENQTQTQTT